MQKLIFEKQWLSEYYIDASHRTQETIIKKAKDGHQTYIINATESRVLIHSSIQMGKTYLLENGGEKHVTIFGKQLASIIAQNMTEIKVQPQQFAIHAQNDTATRNNPENIRNIVIESLRDKLLDQSKFTDQTKQIWINKHNIKFDFTKFIFILSQESFHLWIRISKAGGFKRCHPDTGYIKKDITAVIRKMRLQYDPVDSPPILSSGYERGPWSVKKLYLPYDLIEEIPMLKDSSNDFVLMRAIQGLWMQRNTHGIEYKKDLTNLFSKQNTNGLGINEIRKQLTWAVKHCVRECISGFIAVLFLFC